MKKHLKELSLRDFWLALGDGAPTPHASDRQRAQRMRFICDDANFNYEGLKLVIRNHRRLGMPSAKRIYDAAKRWADNNNFSSIISMHDLTEIACRSEIRDTRKTHLSKY
jgi:hypothetical protein